MVGIRKAKKAGTKKRALSGPPPWTSTLTVSDAPYVPRLAKVTIAPDRSPWTCPSCGRGNPPWAAFCDHGKAASVDDDEDSGGNGYDGREY